ncbi:MAG: PAS domain S-box protein, partial [Myxococcales bacterium]|nr:PAS domain S-box protein [Myxococcales bacterium]
MTHSRAAKHDGDRVRTPTEMAALQELEFAIHASPTPLLLVDSHGQIVRANRRVEQLFGYERGELLGLDVEVLVPESVHAHHAELRDAFIELPTSRAMGRGRDLHGQTKSGALIPIEIGLDPIERAGENWVIVSILDITERVSAERRIRMALDAVSNAVVMIDARGTIVLANAQTSAMFGRPRGQLIGKPIETLVPERYHRRHQVFRTSYLNVKQARRMGMGRELFGLHADGHEFPVEIALTPIESPDGVLIMCTIMDLTERRRHELETQARNRQLSALNADLTQFAYSASHDLKAPLISISGLLKFAGDDLDAGDLDEVRANIGKAERLAARLARRIEEM